MGYFSKEQRAKWIAKVDAALTALFVAIGYGVTELLSWLSTALPGIDGMDWGEFNWLKVPVGIFIGAIIKGYDRKKYEDPSPSKGLVAIGPPEGE